MDSAQSPLIWVLMGPMNYMHDGRRKKTGPLKKEFKGPPEEFVCILVTLWWCLFLKQAWLSQEALLAVLAQD